MSKYRVKRFVMESGERYCLLVEEGNPIPLYYPNLYITTQIRNRSLSTSAMEAALNAISVLLKFMDEKDEDIEARLTEGRYLKAHEISALRDFCQKRVKPKDNKRHLKPTNVAKETEYTRLTSIASYLGWLSHTLPLSGSVKNYEAQISRMVTGIKAHRPPRKMRNSNLNIKALSEDQVELAFEIFRPESSINPFKSRGVKHRNQLMFLMLYHLGLRGGELLNLRIRDMDFSTNQLVVARRADEKDDYRTYQPLVKTLDRRLPMKDTLASVVHSYIVNWRRKVPNSKNHDFLLVTHKSGPSQGFPISISAYKKVVSTVRESAPDLHEFTGHKLRHTWNDCFSKHMDSLDNPPSAEKQEQIRSYLMGWKEGSGTAAIYNQRFTRNKAYDAALHLQEFSRHGESNA